MKNFLLLTVDNNPIINGGESAQTSQTTAAVGVPPQVPQRAITVKDMFSQIFIYLAMFFAAYWILIRPHKKRQEKIIELQNNLKAGDDVITSAGMHGKIIEVNEKNFLIEFGLNKGVRIPVSKNHVVAIQNQEENQDSK